MLQLINICKSFHQIPVLLQINLNVATASRTAIVGPSGSGKTTLLRTIAGFESPDSGSVMLQNHCLADDKITLPPHRREIGYVPQDGALFPYLSVAQNIAFGLKGSRSEKQRRVDELMELVCLNATMKKLAPHEISGGQQQRVALARALAQRPKLMLLDEPFSALDTGLRAATRQAVIEILAQTRVTTILVTHDQAEALSFASQIAVMKEGTLSQVGSPDTLYRQPKDQAVARFLGDAIILSARIRNGEADCLFGRVLLDNTLCQETAQLMFRPEQLAVLPLADEQNHPCSAKLLRIDFAGYLSTLELSIDDQNNPPIEIKTVSNSEFKPGGRVAIEILSKPHILA